eukprot:258521-Chlamydomonas_euryale.AAC.2
MRARTTPPFPKAVLLANAEHLAAATALLQLQMEQPSGSEDAALMALVLSRAGALGSADHYGPGDSADVLTPLELFYARPSHSVPALLRALAEAAEATAA